MLAGHIGAALAIARAERRINVGVFVAAALLLDIILWALILLGRESVTIPADFASTHQAEFVFPWSHGLLASVAWSALAAFAVWFAYPRLGAARGRAALLVAAAVFSHWLLDALVHRPELPVASAVTHKVGLGLWNSLPMSLAVEAVLVIAGLALYLRGTRLTLGKSIALGVFSLLVLAFTVAGMTVAPPPPSAQAMAAGSLVTLVLVVAVACWLGKPANRGES